MHTYGKLVIVSQESGEQAVELAKEEIVIGRDRQCDIPLADGRVSRSHARLECGPDGCYLVDLGSANGSFLNGGRVERARLSPGDIIRIGNSTLRFESLQTDFEPDVTLIDDLGDLEQTIARETVNMTVYDTTRPRVVVHMPGSTWEVPLVQERTTIGRQPGSDIVIDHGRVSRQHAQIERQDGAFVVRDLGSSNGTWLGNQAVETHVLADGDTFRIGDASLVYRAPFTLDDLTESLAPPPERGGKLAPVVFVPGLMGSELWAGSERIWPNVRYLFTQPEVFALPDKAPLEAGGIVNEVVIVPNLIKQEQYNRLGDFLVESLGYQREVNLFEFGYDWRQDVRDSARRLAERIADWRLEGPFVIMAHSLGSLVTRYYVERLGGKQRVARVVFMGGPHYGVPKSVANLVQKVDLLPFGLMGDRLRQVLVTFPSLYQILPIYEAVFDQDGKAVNVMEDESWLPEAQRPKLRAAREFRQQVGNQLSVPSLSIFGYGIKTISRINVQRDTNGDWQGISLVSEESGDQTIPDASTILAGSEIHPVQQYHGSLFIDNDVRMRLRLELSGLWRSTTGEGIR